MKTNSVVLGLLLFVAWSCMTNTRDYGKELYTEHCSNCHGIEGNGLHELYPPLKNADFLIENQKKLGCYIRFGMEGEITVNGTKYNEKMPSTPMLNEVEIANIINYISTNIEPKVNKVDLKTIEKEMGNCLK